MQSSFPFSNLLLLIIIVTVVVVSSILILIVIRVFKQRNIEKPTNNLIPVADISRPAEKKFKRCPTCQSTYTDKSLNYCLSDGTLLERTDEVETIVFQSSKKVE